MAIVDKTIIADAAGDVLAISAGGAALVEAVDLDVRPLVNTDVVTAELSATDNAVLDAIAASVAAIDTDTSTVIGHLDGVEGLLTTIDGDTGNISTKIDTIAGAVSGTEMQVDILTLPAIPAGTNNIGDVDILSIAAGDNNIGNVDVVTLPSIPAGTNNIGDVDVLSIAAGTNYVGKVRLTDGSLDSSLVDETGSSAVDALAIGGGTPHDSVDSGNPVKIGFKALSALPTAVATADRANGIADLWGRQLVSHIDPAMQVWKSFNATSQQTGTDVWTPAGGKKIAITHIIIGTYGTTAGRLILWFGANADTTYSEGTDQAIFKGSFAPGTSSKPGAVISFATPVFAVTADHEVHCTTDAALSVDLTLMGYEF